MRLIKVLVPALFKNGSTGNRAAASQIFQRCLQSSSARHKHEWYSQFPVPSRDTLPKDLQDRLAQISNKTGFIPNVMNGLSYRPDELRIFLNHLEVVMADRGNVSRAEKEMIAVATSAENNCLFCIVARGAVCRVLSGNPYLADQLAGNWKTADITDRQRAMLEFAMGVFHCKSPTEESFATLESHGLTRDDAWDIGSVVSFFAYGNRMAHLMNLKPNPELYLMGRVKEEKK